MPIDIFPLFLSPYLPICSQQGRIGPHYEGVEVISQTPSTHMHNRLACGNYRLQSLSALLFWLTVVARPKFSGLHKMLTDDLSQPGSGLAIE